MLFSIEVGRLDSPFSRKAYVVSDRNLAFISFDELNAHCEPILDEGEMVLGVSEPLASEDSKNLVVVNEED